MISALEAPGGAWSSRFSRTLSDGKMLRPSMTWQMPRRARRLGLTAVTSLPSSSTRPLRGRSSPEAIRMVVLLPAPFGPSSATTEPGGIESETSRRTVVPPYPPSMPWSSSIDRP